MPCDELTLYLADHVTGSLDQAAHARLRAHLATCETCRAEVDATDEIWQLLAELPSAPVDSDRMRSRFAATLDGYREAVGPQTSTPSRGGRLVWWPARVTPRTAALASAACLVLGVAVGRAFAPTPTPIRQDAQMTELRQELREMRQMVTLSLLQQQSASDRLKGVRWTERLEDGNAEVVSALLDALTHDPNVNVRLAAVEALQRFATTDTVRSRVVMALDVQSSPLVQVALIDFALETQGPGATELLRRVSADTRFDTTVRARATRGLERLGGQL